MARIFISHSSKDNLASDAFRRWLIQSGYAPEDVFLDLHSLGAGDRWRDKLRSANRRCEAVILLASPAALASEEVRREIMLAEEYDKPVLVALLDGLDIDDHADARLTPYRDRQIVDLTAEPREISVIGEVGEERRAVHFSSAALQKIKARLDELGLAADSFPWTPQNLDVANPYPGLRGFGPEDAGLFFGRDPDIAEGLAKLRALRATGDGRLFVIQAASGAGKSSFLKAGLWPRLERDGAFEPLAVLRPAGGALTGPNGLARGLSAALSRLGADALPASVLGKALTADDDVAYAQFQAALDMAQSRATEARRVASDAAEPPSLVFGVDQSEELFAAADVAQSRDFMRLIARCAAEGPIRPIVALTIRDDSAGALKDAQANPYGAEGYDPAAPTLPAADVALLPRIPRERFVKIIEGPASVAQSVGLDLTIEPALSAALVADAAGADALPLLSVLMEQLVEDNRAGRKIALSLEAYEAQGRVAGALDARLNAARQAAGAASPEAATDEALRRLMVPALATWDAEAGAAKRLVADEAAVVGEDPALRLLADQLVEKHLLSRSSRESGEEGAVAQLEVAHEALLRQPPMSDWIAADKAFLSWLETIDRARRLNAVSVGQSVFGEPREQVEAWLSERRGEIPEQNRAFVEETMRETLLRQERELQEERTRRELQGKVLRRTRIGAAAAILLAIGAGVAGWVAFEAQKTAKAEAAAARAAEAQAEQEREGLLITESRMLAQAASQFQEAGMVGKAIAVARLGLPKSAAPSDTSRPFVLDPVNALYDRRNPRFELAALRGHEDPVWGATALADGRLLSWSGDGTLRLWAAGGAAGPVLRGHEGAVWGATVLADGRILSWSADGALRLWDADGAAGPVLRGHESDVWGATALADGRLLSWSEDGTLRLWDAGGAPGPVLRSHESRVRGALGGVIGATALADGRILSWSEDGTLRLWDADGAPGPVLRGHEGSVVGATQLNDGRLLSWSRDGTLRLWSAQGEARPILRGHEDAVWGATALTDGRILSWSGDGTLRFWSAAGDPGPVLRGHESLVRGATPLADGRLLSWSEDGTLRLWDADGAEEVVLRGHEGEVRGATALADGRILSWSGDGTLRLWDADGAAGPVLRGHEDWVVGATALADGRLLSWSADGTLRRWDAGGAAGPVLRGHGEWV